MATILVVDDEKPIREFLSMWFEQEGHRVIEAAHGRQALDQISTASDRPDLVVSDVMMPVIGGLELCRILKRDPSTVNIPVVLMSAAHPRALTDAIADAVIGKPFDLEALEALVERLLPAPDHRV
jgi:CheY-like chemotaxis protein